MNIVFAQTYQFLSSRFIHDIHDCGLFSVGCSRQIILHERKKCLNISCFVIKHNVCNACILPSVSQTTISRIAQICRNNLGEQLYLSLLEFRIQNINQILGLNGMFSLQNGHSLKRFCTDNGSIQRSEVMRVVNRLCKQCPTAFPSSNYCLYSR